MKNPYEKWWLLLDVSITRYLHICCKLRSFCSGFRFTADHPARETPDLSGPRMVNSESNEPLLFRIHITKFRHNGASLFRCTLAISSSCIIHV